MTASDFDSRARTWDDDPSKRRRAERVAALIASRVPSLETKSVLEYGAGTGLLGLSLQPLAARVTLADVSREMLAVADEKISLARLANVTTLRLDLAAAPAPSLRFDVVCTLMTLHHIVDTTRVLHAFHQLLTPGGTVCIADLDREDGSFHGPGFSGHPGFERDGFERMLEDSGFTDVRFETAFEVNKATAAGARSYPVFLAVAQRRE